MDIAQKVRLLEELDPAIFTADSLTTINDRKSLLIAQHIVRTAVPEYVYCDVGSYLGGSLVPHLVDPRCRHILSVDKRPVDDELPDVRGRTYNYGDNSTQKMLDILKDHVPESAFLKLHTHDGDISDLDAGSVPPADLALIDAEHTVTAVFRDFLGTRRLLANSFVVAFHDAHILFDGFQNIETFLEYQGVRWQSYFLPDIIFVVATGSFVDAAMHAFEPIRLDREEFIERSRNHLWNTIAANVRKRMEDESHP